MRVRKTSGKQAGLIVDLAHDAAEAELAFGTAEQVEEVVPPTVDEEVAAPEVSEAPEKTARKKTKKKRRKKKSAS